MIFEEFVANLGISVQTFFIILIGISSLIFSAKDLRLGFIFLFVFSATGLLIFSALEMDATYYVYLTLISFVMMVLSLIISNRRSQGVVI